MNLPLIALTQGDPAGVGPELCLRAAADPSVLACCRPVIFGDLSVLAQCAQSLGLPLPALHIPESAPLADTLAAHPAAAIVDCAQITTPIVPGRPTAAAGAASYRYFAAAIEAAQAGHVAAIATASSASTSSA